MADNKKGSPPYTAAWGTWEELLLAYAVNRFGTNNWNSISSELQKRSSATIIFTPKNCKQKYKELEQRFNQSNSYTTTDAAAIPWIEEIRRLRVAELQQKLQNFDNYISSLQLKVKKLTEEIDDNSCEETKKSADLVRKIDEIEIKNEEEDTKTPDLVISGEKQVLGGDDSVKDDESMNGSNGNLEPVVEDSCDGRPDGKEPVKTEPVREVSHEPESKSEGTVKESSDVQSSASKKRKEGSNRVRRGCSKADDREDEDQLKNSIPVRSWPLIEVMQKVHELGSAVFEGRLDRQEKLRYKNLIKEHIDFEILQTRLKEGWYSNGNNRFFRDLLLLVNNTCIFFPNESQESISAIKLRQFILKEMTSKKKQKIDSKLMVKETSSKPITVPPKRAPEPLDSMLPKPMIVCRKRNSIANNETVGVAAGGGSEIDRGGGGGGKGKKEQMLKRSLGGRKLKEPDSPAKRSGRRPPKKAPAQPSATTSTTTLGKQIREIEEPESLASKQAKKRSKRL